MFLRLRISNFFYRFVRREFSECSIDYILEKKKTINLSCDSKYYTKEFLPNAYFKWKDLWKFQVELLPKMQITDYKC